MKKKYVTPMIAVEHYELTQTIAACSLKIGFANQDCINSDPDATLELKTVAQLYFADGGVRGGSCGRIPSQGTDLYDGICYHTNAVAAFVS